MIAYFRRTLADQLRHHTLLYALTLLGAALGVASVVAIRILNTNAIAAFEASVEAGAAGADLQVLPAAGGLPEELLATVLQSSGVRSAWPVVEGQLRLESGGRIQLIGLDLAIPPGQLLVLSTDRRQVLAGGGWVAATEAAARRFGWSPGQRVDAWLGSELRELEIGLVLDPEISGRLGPGVDAVADIGSVQDLFDSAGTLQRIAVELADGSGPSEAGSLLAARLGPAARVTTPAGRLDGARDLLAAFRLNLTALSYISLLVGVFLVYTSVQASLFRRREEFGLLRSAGATRPQVLGLILAEAGLLGAVGVVVGLPLGYQAAQLSLGMVNSTLTAIYLLRAIEQLEVSGALYWQAAGIGLAAALAGALLPALDLVRRSPRALLANVTLERRVAGAAPLLFGVGSAILVAAGGWYAAGGWQWRPAGFVLGAAVLVALPLQIPFTMMHLCRMVPVRTFGMAFSVRSLAGRLRTSGFAASAVAVAVSMLVGITVLVGSFRSTVQSWIEATIVADVYVTSPALGGAAVAAGLDPELVGRMAAAEGIVATDRLRARTALVGQRQIRVTGVTLADGLGERRYPLRDGSAAQAFAGLREGRHVFISEPLAQKAGLGVGSVVDLATVSGPARLDVGGVTYDYSNDSGTVIMSLERFEELFGAGQLTSVALYLEPGAEAEPVLRRLRDELGGGVFVTSSQAIRRQAIRLFDQTFGIVWLLQLMSLLIAITGIAVALLILARERSGEIAVYRALGALRRQILTFFLGKGVGLGMFGLAAGWAGGAALAAVLVVVINRAYFGWTIRLDVPWDTLALQATLLLSAAAAASFYPALRASEAPATDLSHDDA